VCVFVKNMSVNWDQLENPFFNWNVLNVVSHLLHSWFSRVTDRVHRRAITNMVSLCMELLHTLYTIEGSMVGCSIRKNIKSLLADILWSHSSVSHRRIELFTFDFHSYLEGITCNGDSRLFAMSCKLYLNNILHISGIKPNVTQD